GDATTSRNDAELQVLDDRLMVFSSDAPPGAPSPHDVTDLTLPISGRFIELEICDQTVRFRLEEKPGDPGPVSGKLRGDANQTLFRLGTHPSRSAAAPAVRHSLYAAFNRAISRIDGPPAKGRLSSSVRRVEIFFRP
ncbi:MAG: hypothetical protein PVF68_13595, partial [Acidobacteriota bacterium]